MKRLISSLLLFGLMSVPAAAVDLTALMTEKANQVTNIMTVMRLNWKVGDRLDFNLSGQGSLPIQGTMSMEITADTAEGFTMMQIADLGMFGRQTVEALVDKDTGEIKKYKVNGKEQAPPSGGNTKIVKQEESRITVPKGTFDCIYVVLEDDNGEQTEVWINPMEIPITGMLKVFQASQGIVLELTDFRRG